MTNLRETDLKSPARRVLRPQEAAMLVGVSTMTLWRWERAGIFPRKFKLAANSGPNGSVGYDAREIEDWLEERRASRIPLAA